MQPATIDGTEEEMQTRNYTHLEDGLRSLHLLCFDMKYIRDESDLLRLEADALLNGEDRRR